MSDEQMDQISNPAIEKLAISDLLTRFFQAFDDRNWPMLRDCLCDEVFTDYSSFRDVPASTIPGDEYVEQRRTALQALDMQHNFLNLRVELDAAAETAEARCNYLIHRFQRAADRVGGRGFHSTGHYFFGFAKAGGHWRIARISQHLLRNCGDRQIHGATRTRGLAGPSASSHS
jgi:hypothetical protein